MGGAGKFGQLGNTGVEEARRQIDICVEAGVNLIDTANVYSRGGSEEIIGEALGGKRPGGLLIATKVRFPMGDGPNDRGLSRHHLIPACEASLKRLRTDVIDLYQVHEWDGQTPLEETLEALDTLIARARSATSAARIISGWHLMKALAVGEREHLRTFRQPADPLHARGARGRVRAGADLRIDQGLGILVWSPLAGGLLSGKYRRERPDAPRAPASAAGWGEPPIRD